MLGHDSGGRAEVHVPPGLWQKDRGDTKRQGERVWGRRKRPDPCPGVWRFGQGSENQGQQLCVPGRI